MTKKERPWSVLLRLSCQNAWRWRWRLLTIVLLIMISFCLHILYGSYLRGVADSGTASANDLHTKYYDAMVIPEYQATIAAEREAKIKSREELPTPRYQRDLYGVGEAALSLLCESSIGSLELLGLQADSAFFRIEASELQGRNLQASGDLLLPCRLVEERGLQLGDEVRMSLHQQYRRRHLSLRLVGIYEDDFSLPPALALIEDVQQLAADPQPNRYLIKLKHSDEYSPDVALSYLVDWMQQAYPQATIISDVAPQQMAERLLNRMLSPGNGLLILIFSFMGIGVLTVAMMTFLERRKEMAALKSIGISNSQTLILLSLEYFYSALAGLVLGAMATLLLSKQLSWMQNASWLSLALLAGLNTIIVMMIALAFPIATARIASVNQLLYARTIPLLTRRFDYMSPADSALVLRELRDNLRILRLPLSVQNDDLVVLTEQGRSVKQGETLVFLEEMGGLVIQEWQAWCDGIVIDCDIDRRLIIVEPSDPSQGFYPYPLSLLEMEKKQAALLAQGAAEAQGKKPEEAVRTATAEIDQLIVRAIAQRCDGGRLQQQQSERDAERPMIYTRIMLIFMLLGLSLPLIRMIIGALGW